MWVLSVPSMGKRPSCYLSEVLISVTLLFFFFYHLLSMTLYLPEVPSRAILLSNSGRSFASGSLIHLASDLMVRQAH